MSQASVSPRILIVDTDLNALASLRSVLEQANYEVIQAASFEAAKSLLTIQRPAVLVTDLRLGSFNGLHLLLHGRREHPNLVGIITSPFPDSALEAEAHRLGGAYLVRPFDLDELMANLARLLLRDESSPTVQRFEERRTWDRRQMTNPCVALERRVADRRHSRSHA